MNHILKLAQLFIIIFLLSSCFKQNDGTKKNINSATTEKITEKKEDTATNSKITNEENDAEENDNDEFISNSLFEKWKGAYQLKQENQIDGSGRESTVFSELILIKPDSCIFKSWLADTNGKRYNEDDNYQEFIGGIYATSNRDSIEFYTKRVVSGGNNSLSPLLTLTKKNKNHFIYSLITSPPHNGIIEIPIEKLK